MKKQQMYTITWTFQRVDGSVFTWQETTKWSKDARAIRFVDSTLNQGWYLAHKVLGAEITSKTPDGSAESFLVYTRLPSNLPVK